LINGTGEEPTRTDMLVDALNLLGQSIPVYEEWALTDRWLCAHRALLDADVERFRDGDGATSKREAVALRGAKAGEILSVRFYMSREEKDSEATQSSLERVLGLAEERGAAWRQAAYLFGLFHHTKHKTTGDTGELDHADDVIRAAIAAAPADSERLLGYGSDLACLDDLLHKLFGHHRVCSEPKKLGRCRLIRRSHIPVYCRSPGSRGGTGEFETITWWGISDYH